MRPFPGRIARIPKLKLPKPRRTTAAVTEVLQADSASKLDGFEHKESMYLYKMYVCIIFGNVLAQCKIQELKQSLSLEKWVMKNCCVPKVKMYSVFCWSFYVSSFIQIKKIIVNSYKKIGQTFFEVLPNRGIETMYTLNSAYINSTFCILIRGC